MFQRPVGGGQQAAYIEGHRAVSLANEIFGFNAWSHWVTQQTIDFVDHSKGSQDLVLVRILSLSAIIKVQLKDGAYHEDIGYGVSEKDMILLNIGSKKGLCLGRVQCSVIIISIQSDMCSYVLYVSKLLMGYKSFFCAFNQQ